jgi:signal transduction histidine kinase
MPVRIEQLIVDGRRLDAVVPPLLPPGSASLQFEYTALTFRSPRKVQFRYRLEGFDQEWIHAGTRRQAFYTNLPPRSYRFRVLARSSDGVWSEQGAVLDFAIRPAFYQTTWFYALCALITILALILIWRLRLRQIRHQFALILAERVRLSREIHDTLLQSLTGVAVTLTAVCDAPDSPNPNPQNDQLRRLRKQVEHHIDEARHFVWDLRCPTLETHSLATALREAGEEGTSGTPSKFEFLVTGDARRCEARIEEQVLRIGQEALSNAARHAQAPHVRAELDYSTDLLRLTVSDDGRGFALRTERGGMHRGLLIMQERAELVGGATRIASELGRGTRVEVVVPLPSTQPVAERW